MLKEIFNELIPDNIKDIPFFQDAIDIFIENIEENSVVSLDIKSIFTSDNDIVKRSLLKTYLNAIYEVIIRAQGNRSLVSKINDNRSSALINADIKEILNSEYFITSKTFKESKGTELSINYAYGIAKKLEGNNSTTDIFSLSPLNPFHFKIEGDIFKETYENIVKPLSHPLGFTYVYSQIVSKTLADIFGINYIYDVTKLEVRCLSGYFDVFTSDSTDANVKADFLTRINYLTGELFTLAEYNDLVNVYLNKHVEDFDVVSNEDGINTYVLFTDGTYLEQYQSPYALYYRNYSDELAGNDVYIKRYASTCSLYTEYTRDFEFIITDNLSSEDQSYHNDEFLIVNDTNDTYVVSPIGASTEYLTALETTPGDSGSISYSPWSALTTYNIGDFVIHNTQVYANILVDDPTIGIEPGVTVGWENYWIAYNNPDANIGFYIYSTDSGTYFFTAA